MTTAVIDTNVLLVANNKHPEVLPACVIECVQRLEQIKHHGVVVIDDARRIVEEYLHKTQPNQPKGVGDIFLKWLLQNIDKPRHVCKIPLTPMGLDLFAEFPDSELQQQFDPPDRKFAAVANAHPDKPPIWQATDCKWLDWWPRLQTSGINVEFLCPTDVSQFYRAKFPDKQFRLPEPISMRNWPELNLQRDGLYGDDER
ncbi:MAG: hypothetical protein ABSB19_06135 [Methylomonas sp.]|jgi:hypothetical protein